MMSLTFGLFTQVSGSGPLGPLVKEWMQTKYCCSKTSKLGPFSKEIICLELFLAGYS